MPEIELLTQADFVLNKCGRPRPPKQGQSALYLRKSFLVQVNFPAATASPTQTVTREITDDSDSRMANAWCLRAIQFSSSALTAISFQVLLPNGKFLISQLQDILQVAGYGSYSYAFRPELRCPIGSKLQVTFNVTDTTNPQPMAICFDGAYQYLLRGGEGRICPTDEAVENIPRYFSDPNQNIMAPPWQHGVNDPPPRGWFDEDFTYSGYGPPSTSFPAGRPGSTIAVTAANLTATQQIGMDASEFHCHRILFEILADETVTSGSILARLRLGSGQAVFDDYLDAARYIGSAPWPIDLIIQPNDLVYADLQAVDVGGTGNLYWTMFLEGFKRRRKG